MAYRQVPKSATCVVCGGPFVAYRSTARYCSPTCNLRTWVAGRPQYQIWVEMKKRCRDKNAQNYHNYGGRGISVCQRWVESYDSFVSDMGPRPSDSHSVDRIDGNGPYSPGNCRWASPVEQARNRRTNLVLTFAGKSQPMVAWAEETGLHRRCIQSRLRDGWSVERALTTPTRNKSRQVVAK